MSDDQGSINVRNGRADFIDPSNGSDHDEFVTSLHHGDGNGDEAKLRAELQIQIERDMETEIKAKIRMLKTKLDELQSARKSRSTITNAKINPHNGMNPSACVAVSKTDVYNGNMQRTHKKFDWAQTLRSSDGYSGSSDSRMATSCAKCRYNFGESKALRSCNNTPKSSQKCLRFVVDNSASSANDYCHRSQHLLDIISYKPQTLREERVRCRKTGRNNLVLRWR